MHMTEMDRSRPEVVRTYALIDGVRAEMRERAREYGIARLAEQLELHEHSVRKALSGYAPIFRYRQIGYHLQWSGLQRITLEAGMRYCKDPKTGEHIPSCVSVPDVIARVMIDVASQLITAPTQRRTPAPAVTRLTTHNGKYTPAARAALAQRLREEGSARRVALGFSNRALGEQIGCSATHVSSLCTGYYTPGPALAQRLADALQWPELLESE